MSILKKSARVLFLAIIVFTITACTKEQSRIDNDINIIKENAEADIIDIKLKFRDENNNLADEKRIINEDEVLVRNILDELIKGPERVSKLKPVLPTDIRISAVSIKDKIAHITFDFANSKPTFTEDDEEKAVESIVLTLTELEFIDKVKINVSPINDKFISFVDITKPLSVDDYTSDSKK
ncbi:GerMN domain-containing protein [uncultured Clostridium sp.]|uniref:GerMN domain-containing protein n=1 Tax=uncultured Clostridium sp. TaxID=59620 RepID=UPI0025F310E6|nr:GerMN domain-containing protein [uncultured Clostridium sp.]